MFNQKHRLSNQVAGESGGGAPAPRQSFSERKTAQLREERVTRDAAESDTPIAPEALQQETPPAVDGISEDVGQDLSQGLYADEETDQDDLEGSEEALADGEIPDSEAQAQEGDGTDWEKRYSDLRSETQSIIESRGDMDQEQAAAMAQHLELRFEMEDRLNEAVLRAEYMANTMSGNAQQYQNINWAQVPPDKVQEVQAQAQQAFVLQQQSQQAYEQIKGQKDQQLEQVKQREAAIAKVRLKRTIPNWGNEVYAELREFSAGRGMSAAEFSDITNPVVIEALHAYKQMSDGPSTVQGLQTKRKAQTPRGKAVRRQARDDRGKFASKQVEPNQRGSFADRHKHRLAAERKGR